MPRKVPRPGFAQKYPFADMGVGQRVSLFLKERGDEKKLRNAASTMASRKGWVITGEKLAPDLISFLRVK